MKTFVYNLDNGTFESQFHNDEINDLIYNGEEFVINACTEQEDGVKEKLDLLIQKYPSANIGLDLYLNKDYIEEESEMQTLANIDKFCLNKGMKFNINLINEESHTSDARYASGTYQNLLIARNRVEKLKQKLQNFTYEENGKQVKLSPYEKFLIIYKAVSNNEYNMSENYQDNRMRNWIQPYILSKTSHMVII